MPRITIASLPTILPGHYRLWENVIPFLPRHTWFAGGTITASAVKYSSHFLKQGHEKFENGTVNYLDIPAITNGLNFINSINIEIISARIKDLCGSLLYKLSQLRHQNGLPLINIYGPKNTENRGGTLLLNFFDCQGQQYPFQDIEQRANAINISLRTGCFCNPGIDELNNDIPVDQLQHYFTGRDHGDSEDMMQVLGGRRGAVRLSLGIPTTRDDIETFIRFAEELLNKRIEGDTLPGIT